MSGEFDLIERYFRPCTKARDDLLLGIGDDCALLAPPANRVLATSMDTYNAGVHFFTQDPADAIGHKVLAASLSDLAACGAEPAWVSLSIALPSADERWLAGFARGFCALARSSGLSLTGGDTTRGPMSISVHVTGFVAAGQALRRDGARAGDAIYVSGRLGDAALALRMAQHSEPGSRELEALQEKRLRPQARIALGRRLAGLAHACIDLSDGLSGDLAKLLSASGVGATIDLESLPLSTAVADYVRQHDGWDLPLSGGEDYELCFTIAADQHSELLATLNPHAGPCQRIGRVDASPGLRFRQADGRPFNPKTAGYQHFNE